MMSGISNNGTGFRARDMGALLVALILMRMAWMETEETRRLNASFHIAFYGRRFSTTSQDVKMYEKSLLEGTKMEVAHPAPFDVNGDGISEALIMPYYNSSTTAWSLQMLDLTRLHGPSSSSPPIPGSSGSKKAQKGDDEQILPGGPIVPSLMFESQAYSAHIMPLFMVTGLVSARVDADESVASSQDSQEASDNERKKHFFCGLDWHHAAASCEVPCPSGTGSDCPDNQQCYADTPCIADAEFKTGTKHHTSHNHNKAEESGGLITTPHGGLPSIGTVWSDGTLSLHSLTADKEKDSSSPGGKKSRSHGSRHHTPLELREMWRINLLQPDEIQEGNLYLTFVNAQDAASFSPNGMFVVANRGRKSPSPGDTPIDESLSLEAYGINAYTGKVLWSRKEGAPEAKTEDKPVDATTSEARKSLTSSRRRQSHIPLAVAARSQARAQNNCWQYFRDSLMSSAEEYAHDTRAGMSYTHIAGTTPALPHAYFGVRDNKLTIAHLDRQHRRRTTGKDPATARKHQKQHLPPKPHTPGHSVEKPKWQERFVKNTKKSHEKSSDLAFGRPNVVLVHHANGMQALSLQNGKSVCHLSLLEGGVYTDLNADGNLDYVSAIMEGELDPTNEFIMKMLQRVSPAKNPEGAKSNSLPVRICHLQALSGLPAKEELFSPSLCSFSGPERNIYPMTAAPPLVINHNQVVVALSSGRVIKTNEHGKKLWSTHHSFTPEGTPAWGHDAASTVATVEEIHFRGATARSNRPILVVAENGMALFTSGAGHVLHSASFPAPAVAPPLLVDLNGDGTEDVLILSADTMWGFVVRVQSSGSIPFRMAVGLAFVAVALGLLRNRFQNGKRSTDA